jgi:hypothetical protein
MIPKQLSLVLNSSARISILDTELAPAFLVEAPIKGASLSTVRVSAENMPGAHAFLCSVLIDGRKDVHIGEQDAAELHQIGLFASADAMPQAVAYQFPLRDPADTGTFSSEWCPAGRSAHVAALRIPPEWSGLPLQFEPHHHGSVWAPVLVAACPEQNDRSAEARAEALPLESVLDAEATHSHFEREGFAILENLLPTEHVNELGQYFQALAEQGFLACADDHVARRHYAHNHPVASFWHEQLNERVSQLAGRPTKPTYSYVSLYIAGGNLLWHTDRPPCEYTIALLLDYAPLDADRRSSWALKIERRDGTICSLHQRVGEALILKGRELKHGREVLPDGHRSASLLFHFVDEDYDGVLR